MQKVELVLGLLSCIILVMSLIPLIRNDYWTFRVFEYPRFQKFVLSILILAVYAFVLSADSEMISFVISGLLLLNVFYLAYQIFPYTKAASKQVLRAERKEDEQSIRLLTANVYQYNRRAAEYLKNISAANPDVILLLETDKWWLERSESLEKDYPYSVKVPLENTYGMLLYSKYTLKEWSVEYLVEQDIPSIHAKAELPSGKLIQLFCVHPTPPVPNENPRSTERDKELLIVAKLAKASKLPVIVLGDLNDVAWSYTTDLFCKISGLLDPRKGRGFFNTFHARYPFLRFPLDHIFCSVDFKLLHLSRLPAAGSDHFPMFAELQYERVASLQQEEPVADAEEKETADEKIAKNTA